MEKKEGLISKLIAKFTTPTIKRKIVGLIMSLNLALVPLMTSCAPTTDPNLGNGGGTNITNPVDPSNPSNPSNPYSQYSALLQSVLTSDYYNGLIAQAKANSEFYNTANFDPHPYAFLEDQGHDINAIKNGTLECFSTSYLKDNNYYIQTKVENKDTVDYYTCYTLKYTLTDDEIKDLNILFPPIGTSKYYQAPLFIQEIANKKTATVESTAYLTKTCEKAIYDKINELEWVSNNITTGDNRFYYADFIFLGNYGEYDERKTFEVLVYPKLSSDANINKKANVGTVKFTSSGTNDLKMLNENILNYSTLNGYFFRTADQKESLNNLISVNFYNSQKAVLNTSITQ